MEEHEPPTGARFGDGNDMARQHEIWYYMGVRKTLASLIPAAAMCASAFGATLGFRDIAGKGRDEVVEGAHCCVTGVVTLVSGWRGTSGIVADLDDPNGHALWFAGEVNNAVVATLRGATTLHEGDVVEIVGGVSQLAFAPGLKADTVTVLGARPLPAAPLRRLRDFDWGVMDNRRACMDGVLMNVQEESAGMVRLQLGTADGMFLARVGSGVRKWRELVDAGIRVRGVAMSVFNIRNEFVGMQMEVLREDDFEVLSPPPEKGSVPAVSLGSLLSYSPEPPDCHRRRVRGTVTYVRSGEFVCIQSGESALVVDTSSNGFAVGDEVEAVGFPCMKDGLGRMMFAQVFKVGGGSRPAPVRIGWGELESYPVKDSGAFQDFNARFVQMSGTLESFAEINGRTKFTLMVEGYEVAVEMDGVLPREVRDCVDARPMLSVVGIVSLVQERGLPKGRLPAIAERRLLVSSASDVELVRDATWQSWRRGRLLRRLTWGAMALVLVLLLALLVRFIRFRRDYLRLGILTQERKRMAGDLHDTIEQSLVTAKIMLDTSVSLSPDAPEELKRGVAAAQEILMSAKAEIRERVFNLRDDELFKNSAQQILKAHARKLSGPGIVRVRAQLRGLPDTLPAALMSDILFIVQESVTNAIKHGHAKNVILAADPAAGGRGFVLRIVNDGAPFDPRMAPGPESGHFGLSGMRERARRAGMLFSITTERGQMAVRLEVNP